MASRPNIVFYFTDQQRPDTIGCYGQKLPVTPKIISSWGISTARRKEIITQMKP